VTEEPDPELCERVAEELNERGWHLTAAIARTVLLMPQYERGPDGSVVVELAQEMLARDHLRAAVPGGSGRHVRIAAAEPSRSHSTGSAASASTAISASDTGGRRLPS
jgi:hypothetical protein